MFIAIADFSTAAADRPAALAQLDGERGRVRAMPGNLTFRVYASRDDSGVSVMRVLRAIEELAAGNIPVTRIAFKVGYSSLSAFNAAFQESTGRTPTEYRASFRP